MSTSMDDEEVPLVLDDVGEEENDDSLDVIMPTEGKEQGSLLSQDTGDASLSLSNVEESQNCETPSEKHNSLTSENNDSKKGSHACQICEKVFKRKVSLVRHLNTHEPQKEFKCTKCDRKFHQLILLSNHLSSGVCDKHKCFMCGKKFRYKRNLSLHCRVHQTERRKEVTEGSMGYVTPPVGSSVPSFPRSCPYCDKKLKNQALYERHLRVHWGDLPYLCLRCYTKFANREDLLQHGLTHNREGDLQLGHTQSKKGGLCEHCGKMFTTISSNPKRNCHCHAHKQRPVPVSCDICGRHFDSDDSLINHMKVHGSDMSFFCPRCRKLVKHIKSVKVHYIGDEVCPCHVCDNGADGNEEMSNYKSSHIEKTPSESPQPLPVAPSGNSCTNSMKAYRSEMHVCAVCGKTFAGEDYLANHMKTHYQCVKCKKMFRRKEDLNTHLMFLGAEKLLLCRVCQRIVHGKREFERHIYGHIRANQLKSIIDDKLIWQANSESGSDGHESFSHVGATSQSLSVKIQMVTQAGKNSFKCSQCGKKVPLRHNPQDHLRDESPEITQSGEEFVIITRFGQSVKNQKQMTDSYCKCNRFMGDVLTDDEIDHPTVVLVPHQEDVECVGGWQTNEPITQAEISMPGTVSLPSKQGTVSLSSMPGTVSLPSKQGTVSLSSMPGTVSFPSKQGTVSLSSMPGTVSLPSKQGTVSLSSKPGTVSFPSMQGTVSLPSKHENVSLPSKYETVSLPSKPVSGPLPATSSKDDSDVVCKKAKYDNEVLSKVDDIKLEMFDPDIIVKEEWDISWC
ncbi:zinc finger protein 271-like [Homarus americanus]|uniref:zinc finger protein 271-like n=1 Tax=Homarus americanus TaxID=6706 RepID=UPI001C447E7D|nr:zinc finger protein 271-like [Homarus americanus]XP_042238526.1 zinc finger protein 271-like [Homarus americanus]